MGNGLVAGGTLGMAIVILIRALLAARREENGWPCYWVIELEAYIIASPLPVLSMLVLLLVKGPKASGKTKLNQGSESCLDIAKRYFLRMRPSFGCYV